MLLSYQNTVQVGIYSRHTLNDTVLTYVSAYGIGREDSLLYDTADVSTLFLNLNMKSDSTSFIVKSQTLQDRISFYYRKHVEPVSGSGGITMEFNIDSIAIVGGFIDSAAITYSGVNYNESLENVKIFVL